MTNRKRSVAIRSPPEWDNKITSKTTTRGRFGQLVKWGFSQGLTRIIMFWQLLRRNFGNNGPQTESCSDPWKQNESGSSYQLTLLWSFLSFLLFFFISFGTKNIPSQPINRLSKAIKQWNSRWLIIKKKSCWNSLLTVSMCSAQEQWAFHYKRVVSGTSYQNGTSNTFLA